MMGKTALAGGRIRRYYYYNELPKGSNVVVFGFVMGFWVRDYNILPKKELHWRVWVMRTS